MSGDSLTIRDNRTGKTYEVPVEHGTVRAMDLRQIKVSPDDFGLMTYDPGFMKTAACRSQITFIDGDRGILLYRGYPIEQLAARVHDVTEPRRGLVDARARPSHHHLDNDPHLRLVLGDRVGLLHGGDRGGVRLLLRLGPPRPADPPGGRPDRGHRRARHDPKPTSSS
jgi:hypothetical protein